MMQVRTTVMCIKELIWNFTCVFCSQHWSFALSLGSDHLLINKELHCPWCGKSNVYVTDDDYK